VVERVPEVPGEAADGFPLLLKLRYRPAEHLPDQVVEHAEPDQPAEHQEGVAEHDRLSLPSGAPPPVATKLGVMKLPSQCPMA
jgi:hypothetical protein